MEDWLKSGLKPSLAAIIKRFGSWNKARKKAGLEVRGQNELQYSDGEILDALRSHSDYNLNDWRKSNIKPSYGTIIHRFGSWNKAHERAGLPTKDGGGKFKRRAKLVRRAVRALNESSDSEEVERARRVLRRYPQTYRRVIGG